MAILLVLTVAWLAAAPARVAQAQAAPLVFLGDENIAPYEYLQDGMPKGVNVEFLQAVGKALGRPVEIRLMDWKTAQDEALAGRGDALSLMTPTAQRRSLYDFTSTTFPVRFTFFVRADDRDDFLSVSLADRRIGVTAGGLPNAFLRERHPEADFIVVRDNTEGVRRLQRRDLDAFAMSEAVGTEFLRGLRVSGITPVAKPFFTSEMAIAVPKGNPELHAQLDRAVAQLKSDGTLDRLAQRLARERILIFTSRELVLGVVAAVAALAVLVLLATLLFVTRRDRRRLAEREARLRAIFAGVADAIVSVHRDGRILDLNQAFVDLHGLPDTVMARQTVEWYRGEFRMRHLDGRDLATAELPLARALGGAAVWNLPVEVRRRANDTFCFYGSFNAVPIRNHGGEVEQVVVTIHDITDRVRSDRRQALLTSEIDHRARNALAVVQAVVRMTRADSIDAFSAAISGRIETLARSHARLSKSRWLDVDLNDLVSDELQAFAGDRPGAISWSGPEVELDALAVQPLSMVLHELATNAAKYGALATSAGHVALEWQVGPAGGLRLDWQESGGPPVAEPATTGVGSTVITGSVRQLAGTVRFDWAPLGLHCVIELPGDIIRKPHRGLQPVTGPDGGATAAPAALAGRRILVVEDDALLAAQMVDDLRDMGCVPLGPVASLTEAFDFAGSGQRVDAAVLDVNIGGRPVWPFADLLRDRGVPFLFASGYGETEETARRRAPVVQKPFAPDALNRALRRILGATRAP